MTGVWYLNVCPYVLCVICMYLIFRSQQTAAHWIFASSLISLLVSLVFSLIEIFKSTSALDLELSDMELKQKNIIRDIWDDTIKKSDDDVTGI